MTDLSVNQIRENELFAEKKEWNKFKERKKESVRNIGRMVWKLHSLYKQYI